MSDKEKGESEDIGGVKSAADSYKARIKEAWESNFSLKEVEEVFKRTDEGYSRIAKQLGVGREYAREIKTSLTNAYSEVASMGGKEEDILNLQSQIIKTTGRNIQIADDYLKDLVVSAKVTGQEANQMVDSFVNAGINLYNIADQTQAILDTSRKLGVSVEAVTSQVMGNLDKLDTHNFKGGVEGLAKMAATTSVLKMDMSTIMQSVDKAFDPEGAIEMAASFQRLGVTQSALLDPLKLMNMSMNDPEQFAKSVGEMGKSLTELDAKGNIKIAPGSIRRMKQLASTLGMQPDQLAKISKAAAEADIKMKKISFPPGLGISEEQRQLLMNITQIKDGQVKVKVGGKMQDVNEVLQSFKGNQKAMDEFFEKMAPKSQEEIMLQQMTHLENIDASLASLRGKLPRAIASTTTADKIAGAESDIVRGASNVVNKTFQIGDLSENFEQNFGGVASAVAKLASGEGSFEQVGEAFKAGVTNTWDALKLNASEFATASKEEQKKLIGSTNEFTAAITNILTEIGGFAAKNEKLENFSLNTPSVGETNKMKTVSSPINYNQNTDVLKQVSSKSNLNEEQLKQILQTTTSTNVDGTLKLDIDIKAPAGVDTKQLELALADPKIREAMIKHINNAKSNDGAKGWMKK